VAGSWRMPRIFSLILSVRWNLRLMVLIGARKPRSRVPREPRTCTAEMAPHDAVGIRTLRSLSFIGLEF